MVTPKELIEKEINQHIVDCNKYLYHYTKLNIGFEYILYNGTLRMSPFFAVNDPYESKKKSFGVSYNVSDFLSDDDLIGISKEETIKRIDSILNKQNLSLSKINEEANKLLTYDCKLICFSRDNSKLFKADYPDHIYYRGYCRPRMWAQYADNHRGFCFVFDKKELNKQIYNSLNNKGKIIKGNVQYSNVLDAFRKKIKHLDFSKIKEYGLRIYLEDYHLKLFAKEIFFKKALDWRDELEYRWVLISNEAEEYIYFPFGNALKEIYVGINFPKVYEELLYKLNDKYQTKMYRIVIHDGVFHKVELRSK